MGERLSGAAMPRLFRAPHPDVPLGFYVHTKTGGEYLVVGGTFAATPEEGEVMVHYVHREQGYSAHRTVRDFLETVTIESEGGPAPRFRRAGSPISSVAAFLFFLRIILAHPISVLAPPDATTVR
jgi:hypothetical protein